MQIENYVLNSSIRRHFDTPIFSNGVLLSIYVCFCFVDWNYRIFFWLAVNFPSFKINLKNKVKRITFQFFCHSNRSIVQTILLTGFPVILYQSLLKWSIIEVRAFRAEMCLLSPTHCRLQVISGIVWWSSLSFKILYYNVVSGHILEWLAEVSSLQTVENFL